MPGTSTDCAASANGTVVGAGASSRRLGQPMPRQLEKTTTISGEIITSKNLFLFISMDDLLFLGLREDAVKLSHVLLGNIGVVDDQGVLIVFILCTGAEII